MTNLEINQLLHERVMEECWHEWKARGISCWACVKCFAQFTSFSQPDNPPDYTSSWEAYGRLLEVAMIKEWWPLFIALQIYDNNYGPEAEDYDGYVPVEMLNPLRGSTAMAEFVKERGI